MTKFGGLAIALILLVSLAGPLPSAQAQDNPVNLELGGEGATSWNIANIVPGDSGTKTVTLYNAGDVDGFVIVWVSHIVPGEGENPESETGDTAEPGELDNYLLFSLSCSGLSTNLSLPTTIDNFPHNASESDIKISPLNVDQKVTLEWHWELPDGTGNEVQGDSLSFTINYMLEGGDGEGGDDEGGDEGTTDVRIIVVPPPEPEPELGPLPEPGLPPEPEPEPTLPTVPAPAPGTTDVRGEIPLINWPVVGGITATAVVGLLAFFLIRRKLKKKAH